MPGQYMPPRCYYMDFIDFSGAASEGQLGVVAGGMT